MKSQRYKYVDFFKFIGITLMIMGHVGFGSEFDKYIHAFHMPLFFIASGYCFFSGRKIGSFIARKCQTLLIPYFMFSIITYMALRDINKIDFSSMQHVVWLNNINTPIAGVWFLTALLWANLIYYFIDRIPSDSLKWFCSVVVLIFGMTIEKTIGDTLPWSLAQGLVGVFFLHIGTCLNKSELIKKTSIWLDIVGFLVLTCLIFLNNHVNVRLSKYDNYALFLINAVGMSVLLMALSLGLDKQISRFKAYDIMCSIGRKSICYLALNQVVIRYTRALSDKAFSENCITKSVFIFLIAYIIMFLLTEIITRTKLAILIGNFGNNID